jgi:tRNA-2-methylthio-N6-dimethylallyladenosine synthase
MNFSDSEIVASILSANGYNTTQVLEEADLVLVNTCPFVIKQNKQYETFRKIL